MPRYSVIRFVNHSPVFLLVLCAVMARTYTATASPHKSVKDIALILESLKKELGITNAIQIKVVKSDRLGLSVRPIVPARGADFLLSIDSSFLRQLNDEELRAALAHELGHVWIYTHHPYLQTEALANQIAMRAVPRDSFKKLYATVWSFEGTSGSIETLLGPEQKHLQAVTATTKH